MAKNNDMIYTILLALIAAIVAGGLLTGFGPIWPAITLYWVVVTVKNVHDICKKIGD